MAGSIQKTSKTASENRQKNTFSWFPRRMMQIHPHTMPAKKSISSYIFKLCPQSTPKNLLFPNILTQLASGKHINITCAVYCRLLDSLMGDYCFFLIFGLVCLKFNARYMFACSTLARVTLRKLT
jgi:hypothetical protein